MTKKRMIVSLCLLTAAAGLVLLVRGADACTDCDSPEKMATAAAPATSPEGSHCSLAPGDRQHAAEELKAFNQQYLDEVATEITASYSGDKQRLGKTLDAIIEREASCCSHLEIRKLETQAGYQVTVRGERMAIAELQSILAASVP